MWSSHEQQAWQVVEKHVAHPGRHAVRPWSLEVPVDNDDCNENRDNVHDEGKQQVLGDERDLHRGRRQDLGHEQQEHNQSQQDGNTHRHLFPGVSRQIEDTDAEE